MEDKMKNAIRIMTLLGLMAIFVDTCWAQDLFVYPGKGQTQDQMEKDKFACYEWAKQNTGVDPMQAPKATEPPPMRERKKGGLLRGAALGAAVGGIVDGGHGAGKGAAVGALLGGVRRSSQVQDERMKDEQWAQQQVADQQRNTAEYNRAYKTCLEAKGYTVN